MHRMDARVKILGLLGYSIAIFFVHSWPAMILFALIPLAAALKAKLPFGAMIRPLIPVLALALFALVFAVFAEPSFVGFSRGCLVALRMVILVVASFVVCLTTDATELLRGFSSLIAPLGYLRVPVDSMAFTLALALRFIPLIAEEYASIRRAQKARAGGSAGVRRRIAVALSAFMALFIGLFRRGDALAVALDARCYGASRKRTTLR